MLIAREKRNTNIVEFILYMWQVEDMVRAASFDRYRIEQGIIQHYDQPPVVLDEIREWYDNLIRAMRAEKIESQGHLKFIRSLVMDLNNLHQRLLSKSLESEYQDLYRKAKPSIDVLKEKSLNPEIMEIEACLNGLYGYLLMKIRSRKISKETQDGINAISHLLAHLAMRFKEEEEGG